MLYIYSIDQRTFLKQLLKKSSNLTKKMKVLKKAFVDKVINIVQLLVQ